MHAFYISYIILYAFKIVTVNNAMKVKPDIQLVCILHVRHTIVKYTIILTVLFDFSNTKNVVHNINVCR